MNQDNLTNSLTLLVLVCWLLLVLVFVGGRSTLLTVVEDKSNFGSTMNTHGLWLNQCLIYLQPCHFGTASMSMWGNNAHQLEQRYYYCYVLLDDDFQDLYEPQAICLGSINDDNFICIKQYCYVLLCMLPILLDVNLFLSTAFDVRHCTKQYSELWVRAKLCKLEPTTHVQPTNKQTIIWLFLMGAALKLLKVCQIVALVSSSNLWRICQFSPNIFTLLVDLPGCVVAIPCHRNRWFTSDNHVILYSELPFPWQGLLMAWILQNSRIVSKKQRYTPDKHHVIPPVIWNSGYRFPEAKCSNHPGNLPVHSGFPGSWTS